MKYLERGFVELLEHQDLKLFDLIRIDDQEESTKTTPPIFSVNMDDIEIAIFLGNVSCE
jgi:hypothetical protein